MLGRNTSGLALAALLVVIALVVAACAPGTNPMENVPPDVGQVAGFWLGLWHGFIAPVTFVISIFRPDVNLYEVHNNGIWYNLGFAIGASILFGIGHGGRSLPRGASKS
jgi:hypothetical protein